MSFNPETRRLSIGLDNGTISEFILSEDYNKMTPVKNYQAHQSRVTMILFVLELEWVLSTGQDKLFAWHCSESARRLGGYRTSAVASGLQFDVETRHVFIGDQSGQVTILTLEQDTCTLVTAFRGHTGGVTALCWDPVQRVLFSGSSDHSVIMWDIGGRKGTAIELQGHNDKVQALSYAQHTRQLISCGGDGGIVVWNMDVERQETPEWLDSDSCQKCDQPFFWNFKQMWDSKKIGLRQHHCRKCGKAVCGKCSSKRSSIPLMGFEFEVRVCDSCHEAITDEEPCGWQGLLSAKRYVSSRATGKQSPHGGFLCSVLFSTAGDVHCKPSHPFIPLRVARDCRNPGCTFQPKFIFFLRFYFHIY
ncbi:WD repeat and FYVE domain-containing protein 2 isoform X3 [Canis lupus familiaris]|nr:WD repeat and FYVE domain-containing protein 2 isoform X4 [Canis lupus dingo]XP_038286759.1 WD repeat and FYVE domain-containing protein 2 isoform X3 [Canis lupus familiaris]XP_038312752.1 WD repeat and FYVE domain-containing protein 2 isoform X3 [Canis lupus familiaris]XP_038425336.1 WD repeat and FYVE domain-containing protein 2 isoform X3 [Canis lupus familiaris]